MAEDIPGLKEAPPTQPSFKRYLQQKGRDVSELEATLEKQKLIKETRNMEGMTPTPKAELKRESLVKLTAKLEGTTPEKVEEKLQGEGARVLEVPPPPPILRGRPREGGMVSMLKRVEEEEAKEAQRRQEYPQKSFERIQEKLRNREAIRQQEAARKTAIAEAMRPKSFSEMAVARRGNLPEKSPRYQVAEVKKVGPLPTVQPSKPKANAPRPEETLRQKLQTPQPLPQESGIRRFFKSLLGRS